LRFQWWRNLSVDIVGRRGARSIVGFWSARVPPPELRQDNVSWTHPPEWTFEFRGALELAPLSAQHDQPVRPEGPRPRLGATVQFCTCVFRSRGAYRNASKPEGAERRASVSLAPHMIRHRLSGMRRSHWGETNARSTSRSDCGAFLEHRRMRSYWVDGHR